MLALELKTTNRIRLYDVRHDPAVFVAEMKLPPTVPHGAGQVLALGLQPYIAAVRTDMTDDAYRGRIARCRAKWLTDQQQQETQHAHH